MTSSTYQTIVHWWPFIHLLVTHLSYRYNIKPSSKSLCKNKLCQSKTDYIHLYRDFYIFKYNYFLPISNLILITNSGLVIHMVSTNLLSSFMSKYVSSDIYAFKYALSTSNIPLFFSCDYIQNNMNNGYNATVCDDISSLLMYLFYIFPLTYIIPLISPFIFYFIRYIAINA